ncbi:hypothetical protein [Enterococcus ureasiticus]|uniref:N-acetyltransferase domain-containing protein n=1 Tax=Enterococcus ureasiticus TaxID=903984 RepID=A0A1E5GAB3_9ENTE|nr:hypothetical protein [Enterococcus ureasiticus]OEG09648.1 hypothetical protein BCR21_15005 [Enterococcus ureasiticus]
MELINYDILSIQKTKFKNCNIEEEFFSSLKKDYPTFENWFISKQDEPVYVHKDECGNIQGFLYLKEEIETENYSQMVSPLLPKKRLKIGTFKISENGYYMGERFFKVIFENAIKNNLLEIYVTIFSHHKLLIDYFKKFGFKQITTLTKTGELVFVRDLEVYEDNDYQGYPILDKSEKNNYILPIRPEYHTRLLPDAILKTEDNSAYTSNNKAGNALKKVYFGKNLWSHHPRCGDIIFFYRTKDPNNTSPAHYQSVITSIGVVSRYGMTNQLNNTELNRLLNKCVLEKQVIQDIKSSYSTYRFVEFVYFGKLDSRAINLAYMRSLGVQAPRGLDLVSNSFADIVIEESGFSEGIIIE